MTGFLKRDLYLISNNIRFYLFFVAAFAILILFTHFSAGFLAFYVVIFGMSSIMGLFSYDDFNHWTAYAAAVEGGRRDMVNARYLLTGLVTVGMMVFQLLLGVLGQEELAVSMAAVYSGVFLLYAALALPVSYRFGGTRSRTIMIVVIAVLSAGIGMGSSALAIAGAGGLRLPPMILLLPLVGLAALAVSWRVSLGIMERKEL